MLVNVWIEFIEDVVVVEEIVDEDVSKCALQIEDEVDVVVDWSTRSRCADMHTLPLLL